MKKTILSTVILAAISSTSAFAGSEPVDQAQMNGTNPVGGQYDSRVAGAVNTVLGRLNYAIGANIDDINALKTDVKTAQDTADKGVADAASAQKAADAAQKTADAAQQTANDNAAEIASNLYGQSNKDGIQDTALQVNKDAIAKEQQDRDAAIQTLTKSVLIDDQTLRNNLNTTDVKARDAQDRLTKIEPVVNQNKTDVADLKKDVGSVFKGLSDVLDVVDQNKKDQAVTDADQDKSISRADGLATNANILSIQNKGRLDKLEPQVQKNTADIAKKVDQTAFKTDQDRQDAMITANKTAIGTKADQSALDATNQHVSKIDTALQTNINNIATLKTDMGTVKTDVAANKAGVDANKAAIVQEQADRNQVVGVLNTRIVDEATTRADADKALYTGISKNTADISKKVDTTTYDAGQKAQDAVIATKADQTTVDAINKTVQSNTTTITSTSKTVQDNTSKIAGNVTNITNNTTNITNNKTDITALQADQKTQNVNIAANTASVTANATTLKADHTLIDANKKAIADETQLEASHFQTLQSGVKQAQDTGAYAQARADRAFANADANRRALDHTNQQVAANSKQLANHEQRIQDLEANNQTNFNSLKDQQNKDRKEFRAGLAGAFALNSIPAAPADHTVGFGMGAGTFNGQNAVAAGVSARVSTNVSVKSGLSWDSQGNVGAGAGFLVSY